MVLLTGPLFSKKKGLNWWLCWVRKDARRRLEVNKWPVANDALLYFIKCAFFVFIEIIQMEEALHHSRRYLLLRIRNNIINGREMLASNNCSNKRRSRFLNNIQIIKHLQFKRYSNNISQWCFERFAMIFPRNKIIYHFHIIFLSIPNF